MRWRRLAGEVDVSGLGMGERVEMRGGGGVGPGRTTEHAERCYVGDLRI